MVIFSIKMSLFAHIISEKKKIEVYLYMVSSSIYSRFFAHLDANDCACQYISDVLIIYKNP